MIKLSRIADAMSKTERQHYREGELGPGVPERKISSLPKVKEPKVWEFSAHPHEAKRAGEHIDLRLGNPETGIAHSFVLPKARLPEPGKMVQVVPTYDHTIPYQDYAGKITTEYGRGKVLKGRRTQAEVYHADPSDEPGTKVRFNLYEGPNPEEFSIRRDREGRWFLHNKTQTRTGRPDIPSEKPTLKEIDPNDIDPTDQTQALMPKLDGAHALLDLRAGRAPRLFSYREAKISPTGLIEHTHKIPELLKTKVPKELDRTIARVEVLAVDQKTGKPLPAEHLSGLLNAKVWASREAQKRLGVKLQVYTHGLEQYHGKSMAEIPYSEKLKVLKEIEKTFEPAWVPEMATTPKEKIDLLNRIKSKKYPLTSEGVVIVEPNSPGVSLKAKFAPDFDVYVRDVHPAQRKGGGFHDRAGSISYSWTPDGPIVGTVGGFKHGLGRDMLKNPDQYIGRVAKVKAPKAFKEDGELGALFQARFKEWHLDKGDIEKSAKVHQITTNSPGGEEHTRPFSFVNEVAGSDPPELGITMLKPGGRTLENAKSTRKLKVDGVPHAVTRTQDAEVVFAMEKDSMWMGFVTELEKIAITLEQARKATVPIKKKILRVPGGESLSAFNPKFTKATARLVEGYNPVLSSSLRRRAGKIVSPHGGAIGSIAGQITNPKVLKSAGPSEKEMINRIGLMHEGFEVRPGQAEGYHGHMSDVIPKEHNIVSTLPREFPISKRLFKGMRRGKEDELFERATRGVSGKGLTYGESPRLSRHAVKRVGRRMSDLHLEDVLRAHRENLDKLLST